MAVSGTARSPKYFFGNGLVMTSRQRTRGHEASQSFELKRATARILPVVPLVAVTMLFAKVVASWDEANEMSMIRHDQA